METVAAGPDGVLLIAILALVAIGLVMVYSGSAFFAAKVYGGSTYFLKRHALWCALGLGLMTLGARADFVIWRRLAAPLLFISVALLGLCLVPAVAQRVGGATRWLRVGPLTFQPSELAKLALVAYLASVLSSRVAGDGVRQVEDVGARPRALLVPILVSTLVVLLVLREPDLGSAMLLAATALLMFFAAGARVSYLLLAVLVAAPIAYQKLIVGTPWRLRRVLAFLDPWSYRRDVGYQITESLISVGSGGATGKGLGQGNQKLFFLPEAHTDFVFAVVGQELGLVGLALVVLLFATVLWRGARAALRARDLFGTYLAFGLTASLLLGALVHMCVVLGMMPTKGTTLPLVSYGGSAMLAAMLATGVLLNVSSGRPEPASLRVDRGSKQGNRRVRARSYGAAA